jgi:glycosyltransferase involved in cell wall biosynthesis
MPGRERLPELDKNLKDHHKVIHSARNLSGHSSVPGFGGLWMSDVLVSFVVPAYNEEALIGSCLTAITAEVSRTGCQAEIIVVDNGSTDDTRQIALAMPDVKVVDEPQRGLVQARRAGCLAAEGEYIANIDADTVLAEGWLQTALAEFAHSADLVALSGPYIHYDLPTPARLVAAGFYRAVYIVHLLSRVVAGAGSVMQGGNFIVSRSALKRAGGFNPDFRFYGEDAELARRLAKVGKVKFTFALQAFSSGRRLAGEGLFRVLLRYSANYLWTHLFKRPLSADWLDFRHVAGATNAIGSASTIVQLDLQRTEVSPDLRQGRQRS